MQTLTRNALTEIMREKDYTPEEMLDFLRMKEHFISVGEGLRRELAKCGIDTQKTDEQLLVDFKKILKSAGFSKDERKNANGWLNGGVVPKKDYPIRLCFTFRLKGQDALDFLWKTCLVNGFNFRKADDIVYCYCLENGKTYTQAQTMIDEYKATTADEVYNDDDSTKRTHTLRSIFNDLENMDERIFMDKLCSNKKNFIAYSKTAHEEVVRLGEKLKAFYKAEIEEHNRVLAYSQVPTYNYSDVSLYNEIIYSFEHISKKVKSKDTPFGEIMRCFPQNKYLNDMFKIPKAATDTEHDKSRKVFVSLFFADYALDPPPNDYFGDFVISLNTELDRCGYAKLYHANPFDWHIMNCIRSLEYNDQNAGLNPVELFNEVLTLLAEED